MSPAPVAETAPAPVPAQPFVTASESGEAPAAARPAAPLPTSAQLALDFDAAPAVVQVAANELPAGRVAATMPAPAAAPPADPAPTPAGETPSVPAGERLSLKTEPELKPERPVEEDVPIFVQGQKITGQAGVQTTVEGDAELRKRGSLIKAETITYWQASDELQANEQVRALKNGDLFTGSELRLKLDAQTGYFLDVNYLMAGEKARGQAKRLDFLGQDAYNAEDATYTTCGPGNDDWFLKVGKLSLDFGRDVGEAEDAQIVFLGHKILQVPSISFTLNDRRKSGFLAPSFGSSIQSGQELSIPYYWNIAPNRDLSLIHI